MVRISNEFPYDDNEVLEAPVITKYTSILRVYFLARILFERTNEDEYLSTVQIMSILEYEYGIKSHRSTIYDDIKLLKQLGMDIDCVKTSQNTYAMISRRFDEAELKLLIDAVASSRFISKKESNDLIKKICSLAGYRTSISLTRNISVERRIKSSGSKSIVTIVDYINAAINLNHQIEFKYFEYGANKERKLRNNGEFYRLSPYRLVWNGEFYYVVGYYEKYDCVTSFRLDRISGNPKIIDERIISMPKNFDLDNYLNTMSHMYTTDRQKVTLVCSNEVMDAIIDRFGADIKTEIIDDNSFKITVQVAVNKNFFAWIFGFVGKVKIVDKDILKMYKEMLKQAEEYTK